MTDPTDPARKSTSGPGELMKIPDDPFAITLTNEEDETTGFFIKWDGAAWIYADVDSLINLN